MVTRGWIESIDRMFCLEGGLEEWPEGAAFSGAAKSCSPVNKFQKESFLLLETLHLPPSSYSPEPESGLVVSGNILARFSANDCIFHDNEPSLSYKAATFMQNR